MNNLNFISPIGYTGYGITSLNILKNISTKCKVSLFCMSDINRLSLNSGEETDIVRTSIITSKLFDKNSPTLKIWHPNDLAMRVGSNKFYVFPFFELDYIPDVDKHHINSCDTIFTASSWGKKILQNNGITIDVVVCPLGVDTDIFKPEPDLIKKDPNKYVFFSIGKWEKRKSQDVVLECFANAFSINDDVELWLFPHNPFLSENELKYWHNIVNNNPLKDKIKIFPRLKTQLDLNNAINLGDCGLFLSRAEGWNNEILETMAVNKPVICTNYSAHTEYCSKNNSYLIEINSVEPAVDNKWFFGEGNWAKIDDDVKNNIVCKMKFVYDNNIRNNPNGLVSAKAYGWQNTCNIIYETIYDNT